MATTRTVNRCACGRRRSRHARECRGCDTARREARVAEAHAIVAAGTCPMCGSRLRRNLSLAGWWQCEQYGAEGFRARPEAPSCPFQTFTA